jgi:arsenate reductase-like glutaredoxin family protein
MKAIFIYYNTNCNTTKTSFHCVEGGGIHRLVTTLIATVLAARLNVIL